MPKKILPTFTSARGEGRMSDNLSWFRQHRQEWIAETLHIFGFINRAHIERKFAISTPQASLDLQTFQERHPDAIVYDKTEKCYRAAKGSGTP